MNENEAAKKYTEKGSCEDATAYSNNYKAHKKGISRDEMTLAYTEWSKNGKYEEDLCPDRYRGPLIASETLRDLYDENVRSSIRILDVAAGSGRLGEELWKYKFTNMDALDPSEGMLEEAKKKGVYTKFLYSYFDKDLDVPDNSYDVVIIAGGMGEGHIPSNAVPKMAAIVKPGGLVVIVMRKEYLSYVNDYKDNLLPTFRQLEESKKWVLKSDNTVQNYSFNKEGKIFIFTVL